MPLPDNVLRPSPADWREEEPPAPADYWDGEEAIDA